jgi:hypothetical protein
MDMHVEPMLRDCEACYRRFAVHHDFTAPRIPGGADRVHVRALRCPFCAHLNAVVMLMYAHHVVVKPVSRAPGRTRGERLARHLKGAAIDLMARLRPLLP